MKHMSLKYLTLWMLSSFFFALSHMSAMQSTAPLDPLRGINYHQAFDQQEIYEEFFDLMQYWKCSDNVFPCAATSASSSATAASDDEPKPTRKKCFLCCIPRCMRRARRYTHMETERAQLPHDPTDKAYYKERAKLFTKACFNQLELARRHVIFRPARRAGVMLVSNAAMAGSVIALVGANSFGGSFAVYSAMSGAISAVREIIESITTWYDRPAHPLNELEDLFALTKCLIPNTLWDVIIAKFALARNSSDEAQLQCINFITLALKLTCFQDRHLDERAATPDTLAIIKELHRRIDHFFDDYYYEPKQIAIIKHSVRNFVEKIVHDKGPGARYQYLCSPQGRGKSQFVATLNEWLQELLPGYIYFKSAAVHTPAELEGSAHEHGLFLDVLSNQLKEHKRGTLVLLDEPSWINDEHMVTDAKRIFNGNLAEMSTKYFGAEALCLPMPPMLIFVASNSEISDEALASRFDIIQFPKVLKKALINYAQTLFKKNESLHAQAVEQKQVDEINSFLTKAINAGYETEYTSFRDIENGSKLWSCVESILARPLMPPMDEIREKRLARFEKK